MSHCHGQLLILLSVLLSSPKKKKFQWQYFITQTTNFIHLIFLNFELSKKKWCKIHWRGSRQKFIWLGQQETYSQWCPHVFAIELCKNQLQELMVMQVCSKQHVYQSSLLRMEGCCLKTEKEVKNVNGKRLDFSHSNLLRELTLSLPLFVWFWWMIGNDCASWSQLKHNYDRLFYNTWNETHITNMFVPLVMCKLFDYVWAASREIYYSVITERYLFTSYMMSHYFIVWQL